MSGASHSGRVSLHCRLGRHRHRSSSPFSLPLMEVELVAPSVGHDVRVFLVGTGEGGSDSHLSWHCQIDSGAALSLSHSSLSCGPVSEICLRFGHAHRSTANLRRRSPHSAPKGSHRYVQIVFGTSGWIVSKSLLYSTFEPASPPDPSTSLRHMTFPTVATTFHVFSIFKTCTCVFIIPVAAHSQS